MRQGLGAPSEAACFSQAAALQVLNVRLAYKEDGEFAGYGFVVFECAVGDNAPQERAIALDGFAEVHDRVLAVSST